MNRLAQLDECAALDVKIEENRRYRQQTQARLDDDRALATAQSAFDEAHRQDQAKRARLRDLELEVQSIDEQIRGVASRLYGGRVTNAKELAGLERDEEMLKRRKGQVEDQMLDVMAALEQTNAEVRTRQAALEKSIAARAAETKEDRERMSELEAAGKRLEQARAELRARIAPADLATYDSLYASKKGRAISHVKNSSCAACGFVLPSGLASRVHMGEELVFCGNCGRILIA